MKHSDPITYEQAQRALARKRNREARGYAWYHVVLALVLLALITIVPEAPL